MAAAVKLCQLSFRAQGFSKTVVVLTQDKGYVRKPEINPIASLRYRAYPAYLEAIATRHLRYNATIQKVETLEAAGGGYGGMPEQRDERFCEYFAGLRAWAKRCATETSRDSGFLAS